MSTNKKVKCVSRGGYGVMREGEIGELIEIQESHRESDANFTWPEYWVVEASEGKMVAGHAHKFELVDN